MLADLLVRARTIPPGQGGCQHKWKRERYTPRGRVMEIRLGGGRRETGFAGLAQLLKK